MTSKDSDTVSNARAEENNTVRPAERARFLQTLKEDPEFRDAVRRLLLRDELLELPEKFAQFVAYVNEFITNQKVFNARAEVRLDRIEVRLDRIEVRLDHIEVRLDRIDDNIGILKGNAARRLVRDQLEGILELVGVEDFARTLSSNDLIRMTRKSGIAREIPYGERRSFYAADLVIEAVDARGDTCYITAEASFTADNRDSSRAIRNADFITRITGCPTYPVVASMRSDYEVQELINRGTVQWFPLDERELEAD